MSQFLYLAYGQIEMSNRQQKIAIEGRMGDYQGTKKLAEIAQKPNKLGANINLNKQNQIEFNMHFINIK